MTARPGFVAALVIAAVAAPLLAWWIAGTEAMDRLEMRLMAQARIQLVVQEMRLAARAAERLEALRASESLRPWHDQDASADPVPLVAARVSVAGDGRIWQSGWPDFRASDLERLEAAAGGGAGPVEGQPRGSSMQDAQVIFDGKSMRRARPAPPVPVEALSFRWTRLETRAGPMLAAVRRVETPDGSSVQAFTVDRAALESWLSETTRVRIVARGIPEVGAPIPVENCAWQVVIADDAPVAAAAERVALLRSRFGRTFLLGSSLAVLAALAAGVFITQSGRIARQRATFAAAAAHELRTPLASLRLQAELLQARSPDEAAAERAGRIVSETDRVARVVTNILGATRLERGGIPVSVTDGDLAAAVNAIVAERRDSLAARGLDTSIEGADAPLPARFDAEALAHVLGNLFDNAERHARGEPSSRVEVRLVRDDGAPAIRVRDRGPGVPAGLRATIFEPYVRSGDPSRGGLGLGLPIARALCRAMGGDLRLLDETPGATFEITLPAA